MANVVIVGAGGFAREVLDVIEACVAAGADYDFIGFLDDGEVDEALLANRGTAFLGPTSRLAELEATVLIGIASPAARRRLDEDALRTGRMAASVVHPAASVGAQNQLGPGAVLCAGSRVTTNCVVGRHLHLNLNSTIGHDCSIGDYVTIFPGATISGNVTLGASVTIGTGANVIQGVTIGEDTTVGAGAVVVRDLPAGVTAVGMPARPLKA